MEYQVPQFIEVESKIVGPLTLKQFIYVAGAAGICIVFFAYLPFVAAFLLSAPVAGLGGALAFYKKNGKPFIDILEAGFNFYTRRKLFLWHRAEPATPETATAAPAATALPTGPRNTPKLTRGRLSELAWSLDVERAPLDAPALNDKL